MDQCLEAVRYQHMEACGNTTAPSMDSAQLQEESNSTSNDTDTQYNVEKHLGEMFEWVRFRFRKGLTTSNSSPQGYDNDNHHDNHHNS